MITVKNLEAKWILDSRGLPTVETTIELYNTESMNTHIAVSSVPSGASTGTHEALELRDGDKSQFGGKGVSIAVNNVNTIIKDTILGNSYDTVEKLEQDILSCDPTSNKSELGANAILSVSMVAHRGFAMAKGVELYQFLNDTYFSNYPLESYPRLMSNVINGGAHADSGLAIQEFMIVPRTGNIIDDIQSISESYHNLKSMLKAEGFSTALGDEGGFAPHIPTTKEVLDKLVLTIGTSKADIALDCAASEFYNNGIYKIDNIEMNVNQLCDFYEDITNNYPIISIEDGYSEDDIIGWKLSTERLGKSVQLVGDDLFVTNPSRFDNLGVSQGLANSILIKLNQIGSVSETAQVINDAKANKYTTIVSHRSGETCDDFMSDLAFASQSEFIKLGAPARGERVAKYNRLINIYNIESNK